MAKKTSVKRVHQLAKELGVSSKDIVSKCQAEGIPDITNHMSAISVGLALTVREWFGGGSGASTAVETAAPVDVAAARKKAPRRAKAKSKPNDDLASEAATAVKEPAPAVFEQGTTDDVTPGETPPHEFEEPASSVPVVEISEPVSIQADIDTTEQSEVVVEPPVDLVAGTETSEDLAGHEYSKASRSHLPCG